MVACALAASVPLLFVGAGQAWKYTTKSLSQWRPVPRQETVEYRLASWLDAQNPRGRVFATGGLRFRLNAWFDEPQIGGTFETGLRTRVPLDYLYQIRTGIGSKDGEEGKDAVLQLKSMAVEYVVVHGPKSEEYYHDIRNPTKFDGLLERVHSDGDNYLYRVPFHSYAHLVRPNELPIHHHPYWLPPYAAAIDGLDRPHLASTWNGPNELRIDGPVPEGMSVVVLVNHDAGWRAEQDGRPVAIEATKLGVILVRARTSAQSSITLRYEGTLEPRVMAAVSGLAWVVAIGALFRRRRAGCIMAPALPSSTAPAS